MHVQQGFADVNGTRLYYEVAGDGEAVVLVHGFTLDHRMWDDQFAALAARHRVLRYDLRGSGASSVPDRPYRHVDDLAALLNHFGIARAAIVGLSLGGMIATDFALTYPEMVTALIPVASILSGHQWSKEWDAEMTPIRQAGRAGDIATSKALWLAHGLFTPARRDAAVGTRLEQIVTDYSGWHWRYQDPVQGIEPPAAERLDRVGAPTLVIVGERKSRIASRLPTASRVKYRARGRPYCPMSDIWPTWRHQSSSTTCFSASSQRRDERAVTAPRLIAITDGTRATSCGAVQALIRGRRRLATADPGRMII